MWASWAVAVVLVVLVASVFAFAGWIVAVPMAILIAAGFWAFRGYTHKRGTADVNWMRDQARTAGPLDKGGVEFTDRDRESLSS